MDGQTDRRTGGIAISPGPSAPREIKITASFSYMDHNIQKCEFLAIRGALGHVGGPYIIGPGPSCFPAILSPISSYI